jgi:hypothetical protein
MGSVSHIGILKALLAFNIYNCLSGGSAVAVMQEKELLCKKFLSKTQKLLIDGKWVDSISLAKLLKLSTQLLRKCSAAWLRALKKTSTWQ